jgi:TetR/AcrR family transcriptional regulator
MYLGKDSWFLNPTLVERVAVHKKSFERMTKQTVKRDSKKTKARILEAATQGFSEKGYDGARVDEIALAANVNKTTMYHYFGSKENLFTAVLENVYKTIRQRQSDMELRGMDPVMGMRKLVEFTACIWAEIPQFNRLLDSENLHEAKHVRNSPRIREMYDPLMATIDELLDRGQKSGQFRHDVDLIDLYISISALSAHYFSRRHTLEAIFQQSLIDKDRLQQRIDHCADVICGYLAHKPDQ